MRGSENGTVADHRCATLESVRLLIRGPREKCDHPWELGEISLTGVGRTCCKDPEIDRQLTVRADNGP